MRKPLLVQTEERSFTSMILVFLLLFTMILVASLKPSVFEESPVSGLTLPKIMGALACGSVLAGQQVCQLNCASGSLKCSWTSCDQSEACAADHVQMSNRECFKNVVQEQKQCCTCASVLDLRGGFTSQVASSKQVSGKPGNVKMTGSDWGQIGTWSYPEMPESFSLGNDPEWSLTTYVDTNLPQISEQVFLKGYIPLFNALLNEDYMAAKLGTNPYDPASWINLGAPLEEVRKGKEVLYKVLQGWFGGNPTQVYAVGPDADAITEIPTQREGIVVITSGKANRIRDILDTSWWGDQWQTLLEENRETSATDTLYSPDFSKFSDQTSQRMFRAPDDWTEDPRVQNRGIIIDPPILMLLVHEDEIDDYLVELQNFSKNMFVICHSAAGSGALRNKAIGVLREKFFQSGIVIDDDMQHLDMSRIKQNRGFFKPSKPAENLLEVMFDIISGDEERSSRWKSQSYDRPFRPQDLLSVWDITEKTIQRDTELGEFSNPNLRKEEMENSMNFHKYRGVIGLSKFIIWTISYRNNILWEDAQDSFARDVITSAITESRLSHLLLDVRIGRQQYPPSQIGLKTYEYWNWVTKQMSVHIASLQALDFEIQGGSYLMIEGDNTFPRDEVWYVALACYQWAKLNVDSGKDPTSKHLWHVFDGIYNQKEPISWALAYVESQNIGTSHPFKDTLPAKLLSLYWEGNLRFIESAENIDLMLRYDPKTAMELGSGPYFDDPYTVVNFSDEK